MGIQTIIGTVLDTAGEVWADASVELQFDGNDQPGVVGRTDEEGAFSIAVFNNATEAKTVAARLSDGSRFVFSLDPEDEETDAGTLSAFGVSDDAVLRPVPGISGVAWGDVTGTLEDQEDLQSALDAKADA